MPHVAIPACPRAETRGVLLKQAMQQVLKRAQHGLAWKLFQSDNATSASRALAWHGHVWGSARAARAACAPSSCVMVLSSTCSGSGGDDLHGEGAGDVASATSSEENQAPMTSPLGSGLSVLKVSYCIKATRLFVYFARSISRFSNRREIRPVFLSISCSICNQSSFSGK
jgi:hypothetical protein